MHLLELSHSSLTYSSSCLSVYMCSRSKLKQLQCTNSVYDPVKVTSVFLFAHVSFLITQAPLIHTIFYAYFYRSSSSQPSCCYSSSHSSYSIPLSYSFFHLSFHQSSHHLFPLPCSSGHPFIHPVCTFTLP